MSNNRSFTEEEVKVLLKRAAELQGSNIGHDVIGLSEDELREIAEETGIDPKFLTAAIHESEREAKIVEDSKFHFWGEALILEEDTLIDGEIPADQWSEIERIINLELGEIGTVNQIGNTTTWSVQGKNKMTRIRITSSNGKTRVESLTKMTQYVVGSQMMTTYPAFILTLIFAAINHLGAWIPLLVSTAMIAMFFAGRQVFKAFTNNKKKKLKRIANELEKLAARTSNSDQEKQVVSSKHDNNEESRISLDDQDYIQNATSENATSENARRRNRA